jgi:hypothetical protein
MRRGKPTRMQVVCIALFLTSAAAESNAPSGRPPLIYSLTTQSETVDSWRLGLVTGLVGEAYRSSHERFLAALQSTALGDPEGLLRPFACLTSESHDDCHRVVEARGSLADEKLTELLGAEAARSARVVELTVIFDGRFFQVPARMYEAHLDDHGKVVRAHEIQATYIRTYSRTQHQEDVATKRNESPFDGKFGSREARQHFWLGGSRPRLVEEMELSINQISMLWGATRSPNATGVLAGDFSRKNLLPRVKDLAKSTPGTCTILHGNLLVAQEVGAHLWLLGPSRKGDPSPVFLIEPRCGFDY